MGVPLTANVFKELKIAKVFLTYFCYSSTFSKTCNHSNLMVALKKLFRARKSSTSSHFHIAEEKFLFSSFRTPRCLQKKKFAASMEVPAVE